MAMRDYSVELRRFGGEHDRRVHAGNVAALREPGVRRGYRAAGKVSRPASARVNWRVCMEDGHVLAIEPNRQFEHVFEGGSDDYWAAVEYAAKQLREGDEQ